MFFILCAAILFRAPDADPKVIRRAVEAVRKVDEKINVLCGGNSKFFISGLLK